MPSPARSARHRRWLVPGSILRVAHAPCRERARELRSVQACIWRPQRSYICLLEAARSGFDLYESRRSVRGRLAQQLESVLVFIGAEPTLRHGIDALNRKETIHDS